MNGHVRKRGKKYSVVLYLGRDDFGKKKQKWIGGFATKKEADKVLAEKLNDMYHGVTVDVSSTTLGSWLTDWLSPLETQVRPSTYRGYEWLVRKHVIPHLGKIKLGELKPQHLQKLYTILLKQERPLSKRSIHNLHGIVHQALDLAVKWELIGKNIADFVKPPRPDYKEMKVWTKQQVRQFLHESKDDRFFEVYDVALATGMRKGEILGLRWSDIDFDNNRLYVRRTLQWFKDRNVPGRAIFVDCKTPQSRRTVTLPNTVVQRLQEHRTKQAEEKLRLKFLYKDQDLVFTSLNGEPVNPRTVDEHWYKCLKASSLTKIRFHDMRHTHATLLLQQGVHPKIVSERLGHSDITITLNTYSHVIPGMQEQTAQDFDQALYGAENE